MLPTVCQKTSVWFTIFFSPLRNWFTIFDVCIAKMLVKEHKFVGVELDKWPSFHSFIPCVAYEPHSCSAETSTDGRSGQRVVHLLLFLFCSFAKCKNAGHTRPKDEQKLKRNGKHHLSSNQSTHQDSDPENTTQRRRGQAGHRIPMSQKPPSGRAGAEQEQGGMRQ